MRLATIVAIFMCIPTLAFSVTIHIPTDYPTIQQGIDAAKGGDTVIVEPGTYVGPIDFKGKAIKVMSSTCAKNTVIDAAYQGSVVTFKNNEGADSVLKGFGICTEVNIAMEFGSTLLT